MKCRQRLLGAWCALLVGAGAHTVTVTATNEFGAQHEAAVVLEIRGEGRVEP
jgi:hypothetical protein